MGSSDWQQVKLGELGEVNRGRSRHRPRDALHLYGGVYPFIQTGDIKASRGKITAHTQTYSEAGLAQSRLWPKGTMVITIAANIAETAILGYPACFPDSVVGFIADPKKADVRFIEYLFRSLRKRIQHENVGTGSVQDNINLQTLHRLNLTVPNLPEQKAIAAILGALDDKIELNFRTNATLEAMARALFKSWFVDFEPTRAKSEGRQPFGIDTETAALFPSRLTPSTLGDIPEGWGVTPIIESAEFINGAAYKNMHFSNDPDALPVIKIAELKSGVSPGTQYTNTDLGNKFRLDTGDILFSWSGSPDTSIDSFIYTGGPAWLNQHIFKVVSPSKERRCFTYWLLKYLNPAFIEIARDKQTTGLGHVTRADMQRMKFAEPSEKIITAFYQKAGGLMDKIQANLSQGEYLAKTRDYLLPKLISGDIRILDARKFVEAA